MLTWKVASSTRARFWNKTSPQFELLLNELNAPELTSLCELGENWALLSFRAHSPLSKQPWLLEINLHSSSPCFHPNPWLLNSHARGNSLKDLHCLIGLVLVCFNHHSNASPKEIVLLQIYCTKGLWLLEKSFNCWLKSILPLYNASPGPCLFLHGPAGTRC